MPQSSVQTPPEYCIQPGQLASMTTATGCCATAACSASSFGSTSVTEAGADAATLSQLALHVGAVPSAEVYGNDASVQSPPFSCANANAESMP